MFEKGFVTCHVMSGKPRPDFYAVCGTDGSQCEGGSDDDKNERGSFPSGHASTYFAIATFLSLYLVRLVFKRIGHSVNFVPYVLAWLPLIPAAYVGATRVYDHEYVDVMCAMDDYQTFHRGRRCWCIDRSVCCMVFLCNFDLKLRQG